jgi:hypothetical protein
MEIYKKNVKLTGNIFLLSLVLLSLFTAPIYTGSFLRFSDIGALLIIILSLSISRKVYINFSMSLWMVFIFWAFINSLFNYTLTNDFNLENSFISNVRILIGFLCLYFTVNICKKLGGYRVAFILRKFVLFHCYILLLYAFSFYVLNLDFLFNIVRPGLERNQLISDNHMIENHFRIIIDAGSYYRMCGLFEEPAWFGWVVTLLVSIILQYQYVNKVFVFKKNDVVIILLAYLLTISISSILGIILVWFLYIFLLVNWRLRLRVVCFFIATISFFYALLPEVIMNRLALVLSGGDGSTSARLVGSLNGMLSSLWNSPFLGTGLGDNNRFQAYEQFIKNGDEIGFYSLNGSLILDMHNILASIFSSLGLFGGIIFMLIFISLLLRRLWIFSFGLVLVFFSVNVFDSYYFICSWGLIYALFYNPKLSRLRGDEYA